MEYISLTCVQSLFASDFAYAVMLIMHLLALLAAYNAMFLFPFALLVFLTRPNLQQCYNVQCTKHTL